MPPPCPHGRERGGGSICKSTGGGAACARGLQGGRVASASTGGGAASARTAGAAVTTLSFSRRRWSKKTENGDAEPDEWIPIVQSGKRKR